MSTTKPEPLELPALPVFSEYTGLIPYADTLKKFPNFNWRQWLLMKSAKHMKEQLDSYVCERKVHKKCKTEKKDRKTLQSHRRDKNHNAAHKQQNVSWIQSTEFVWETINNIPYSDSSTQTMYCPIGEKDSQTKQKVYPNKKPLLLSSEEIRGIN